MISKRAPFTAHPPSVRNASAKHPDPRYVANPAVSYHWESQLEFSYMILEAHRFFGLDLQPYLPFIKNSVRFFDDHYQARERLRSGRPLDAN